jgi:hypothetical protein
VRFKCDVVVFCSTVVVLDDANLEGSIGAAMIFNGGLVRECRHVFILHTYLVPLSGGLVRECRYTLGS